MSLVASPNDSRWRGLSGRAKKQIFIIENVRRILPTLSVGEARTSKGIIRVRIIPPFQTNQEVWATGSASIAWLLEKIGDEFLGTCTAGYDKTGNTLETLTDPVVREQLIRIRHEVRRVVSTNEPGRDESKRKAMRLELRALVGRCANKYKVPFDTVHETFLETLELMVVERVIQE